ncbi:hypothetical protein EDD85DRAFT_931972 [Armillaria nabsnona]|nr:hypothetical protein EDD85DRAFT_931972 [Armillaria nabsnona]
MAERERDIVDAFLICPEMKNDNIRIVVWDISERCRWLYRSKRAYKWCKDKASTTRGIELKKPANCTIIPDRRWPLDRRVELSESQDGVTGFQESGFERSIATIRLLTILSFTLDLSAEHEEKSFLSDGFLVIAMQALLLIFVFSLHWSYQVSRESHIDYCRRRRGRGHSRPFTLQGTGVGNLRFSLVSMAWVAMMLRTIFAFFTATHLSDLPPAKIPILPVLVLSRSFATVSSQLSPTRPLLYHVCLMEAKSGLSQHYPKF